MNNELTKYTKNKNILYAFSMVSRITGGNKLVSKS